MFGFSPQNSHNSRSISAIQPRKAKNRSDFTKNKKYPQPNYLIIEIIYKFLTNVLRPCNCDFSDRAQY
jgi:hypothetical protein